jgi:hypothetical protein
MNEELARKLQEEENNFEKTKTSLQRFEMETRDFFHF